MSKPRFEVHHPASIPNVTHDNNYYPWADTSVDGDFPLPIKHSMCFHNHDGCVTFCNRHNMKQKIPLPLHERSHVDVGSIDIQVLSQNDDNNTDQFDSTTTTSTSNYYNL